jgi:hypothetical protein
MFPSQQKESFAWRKSSGRGIQLGKTFSTGNIGWLQIYPSGHKLLVSSTPCLSAAGANIMVNVIDRIDDPKILIRYITNVIPWIYSCQSNGLLHCKNIYKQTTCFAVASESANALDFTCFLWRTKSFNNRQRLHTIWKLCIWRLRHIGSRRVFDSVGKVCKESNSAIDGVSSTLICNRCGYAVEHLKSSF